MICPECGAQKMSKVYWCGERGDTVRRYRECTKCGTRYRTDERLSKIFK